MNYTKSGSISNIYQQAVKTLINSSIYEIQQDLILNSCDDILETFNFKIKLQDTKLNKAKFKLIFKSEVLKILNSKRFNNRVTNLFSGAGGISTATASQHVINLLQESNNLDYSTILACLEDITDVSALKKLIYTELHREIAKVDFISNNVQYQSKIEVRIKRLREKLLKGQGLLKIIEVAGGIEKVISFIMDILDKIHKGYKRERFSGGYAY